jgi:type IV pilus assembly protein PilM
MLNPFVKSEHIDSIGIDIGTSAIKVVQLKREADSIVLETYGEIALGPYAGLVVGQATRLGDEKLLEAVTDLFREAKITTKVATVAIDSSAVFVSVVTLPKVEDAELKTMMPLEARKFLPIPLSEVQIDWWHVPETPDTKAATASEATPRSTMDVVLAAVKNDTLETYNRIGTKLGLERVEFEITGFSLVRSIVPSGSGMIMCVDIGATQTTISLVRSGIVIDMHVLSKASQDSTIQIAQSLAIPIETAEETKRTFGYNGDAANPYLKEVMELSSYPLFGEVARLSLMFERKYNQTIEGVILIGGGARLPGVMDMYNRVVHIPGRTGTPFDQIKVPDFLQEMMKKIGPSYATAVGLALKKLL